MNDFGHVLDAAAGGPGPVRAPYQEAGRLRGARQATLAQLTATGC